MKDSSDTVLSCLRSCLNSPLVSRTLHQASSVFGILTTSHQVRIELSMDAHRFDPTRDITLEGQFVCLVPLQCEHAPLLWDAMKDHAAELFRWVPYPMRTAEDSERFIEFVLT